MDYTNNRFFLNCVMIGAPFYEFDERLALKKADFLKLQARPTDRKYDYREQSFGEKSQWDRNTFGAKVHDAGGKAKVQQKSCPVHAHDSAYSPR